MLKLLINLWREIRPNALWDLLKYLGGFAFLALAGFIYWIYPNFQNVSIGIWVLVGLSFGLFLLALILLLLRLKIHPGIRNLETSELKSQKDLKPDIDLIDGHNVSSWLILLNDQFYISEKSTESRAVLAVFENKGNEIDGVEAQISYFVRFDKPREDVDARVHQGIWFDAQSVGTISLELYKSKSLLVGVLETNRKDGIYVFSPFEYANGKVKRKKVSWASQTIFIRVRLIKGNIPLGEYKFELRFSPGTISFNPKDFEAN